MVYRTLVLEENNLVTRKNNRYVSSNDFKQPGLMDNKTKEGGEEWREYWMKELIFVRE